MDYDGSETYTLSIKNIDTGVLLPDVLEEISGEVHERFWEMNRDCVRERERGGGSE